MSGAISNTFKKEERLKHRKIIESLFSRKGEVIHGQPIMLVYLKIDLESKFPTQSLFSVSKKKFKRAVDRNRIKRLMKEAFRLRKNQLYQDLGSSSPQYAMAFIFTSKTEPSFEDCQKSMDKLLSQFAKKNG